MLPISREKSLTGKTLALGNPIVVLVLLVVCGQASADDIKPEDAKVVVTDGPFEVVGESGIYGFVIARKATTVTFKPCVGQTFDVERNKLKRTHFTGDDGASPDTHPLIVTCAESDKYWDKAAAQIASEQKDTTVGTVYYKGLKGIEMTASVAPNVLTKTFDDVVRFKDCGSWSVGFGQKGAPLVHVLTVPEATKMELDKLDNLPPQ